jgi:hypothetical protein
MTLVFNHNQLSVIPLPFLAQEFVNHGGVIFKAFALGDHCRFVKRPSIPDLKHNCESIVLHRSHNALCLTLSRFCFSNQPTNQPVERAISFDSQNPLYPQVQDAMLDRSQQEQDLVDRAVLPPDAVLRAIVRIIQDELGLHLLGFDLIVDKNSGQYHVIDVNYWPSKRRFFYNVLLRQRLVFHCCRLQGV